MESPYPFSALIVVDRATEADAAKRSEWIFESVDGWKVKPIYAMSPEQYEDLYQKVTEKKERLRKQTEKGGWEIRRTPPKTITLPNLPEPKQGLTMPRFTEYERQIQRLQDTFSLPDRLFAHLTDDTHEGN